MTKLIKSLRKSLISLPNSTKNMIMHLKIIKQILKRSKTNKKKRAFIGFNNNNNNKNGSNKSSSYANMELIKQLELVFKFIDTNNDGKICSNELSEFLLSLGHDKSRVDEEANGMLKDMDVNGDGFVDLDEYINVVMMSDDDDDGVDDGDEEALERELRDVFQVFDSDKNGLISSNDLNCVLKKLGFGNCGIKECNLMIKGVDKDHDGFVNFHEFRLMMLG